jgi:chromosome segregation ATPase
MQNEDHDPWPVRYTPDFTAEEEKAGAMELAHGVLQQKYMALAERHDKLVKQAGDSDRDLRKHLRRAWQASGRKKAAAIKSLAGERGRLPGIFTGLVGQSQSWKQLAQEAAALRQESQGFLEETFRSLAHNPRFRKDTEGLLDGLKELEDRIDGRNSELLRVNRDMKDISGQTQRLRPSRTS